MQYEQLQSQDTLVWTCPSCQLSHCYNTLPASSASTDERPEIPPRPRFNTNRQQHKPKHKLKVCVINVNGLKCLDKRVAFHAFLHTEQPDVILGQESKLDSIYSNSEIFPPNHNINVLRKDRDIHGGGIFITARNELD